MSLDVRTHELDLIWQNVFTWVSWAIVAVMVALVVFIVAEVAVMRRGQADRGTMHR